MSKSCTFVNVFTFVVIFLLLFTNDACYKKKESSSVIKTSITGIGDPFILLHEGKYYMYATSASDGFKYFVSENLTDWEEGGYCYKNSPWGECDFWAPEVYYRKGKFYMIYSARWAKNHSLRLGVAVADKPEGPFIDIKNEPLFDYGYATIDATLFTDEDGKEYFYFVRDCSENVINGVHTSVIYYSAINEDLTALIGEPVKISEPDLPWELEKDSTWQWNEGPYVYKHAGKYYLNYSGNCYASRYYSIGCAVSDSPFGPFKKYDQPALKYKENEYSGPGHNMIFKGKDGKLYTAFHIHTHYDAPSGDRRACITEVYFDEKGEFKILP